MAALRKSRTVNLRIDPEAHDLIARAAQVSGKSITAFMTEASVHSAQEELLDQRFIGVSAEVVLFAFSAPVVRRFGPAQLIVAGAGASVLRWGVMALDPPLAVLVPLQLLHALTYGAAHLGAILFIARAVPHLGMGSAQAFYATVAAGLMLGIVSLISGALYDALGGAVFLVPALVAAVGCAAGIMLLRGWNGQPLWGEDGEASVPLSPTAPLPAD